MSEFHVGSTLWIDKENQGFFGKGRIELLKKIDELGSLSKAAKSMKMSYKAAWDAMKEMNELSPAPLVERTTGGKGGGGSILTNEAKTYINIYDKLHEAQQNFFNTIEPHLDDAKRLMTLLERDSIRTSARNQIKATIKKIEDSGVNSTLTLQINENITFYANITQTSVKELGLKVGLKVCAIIKASWFTLYNYPPSSETSNIVEATIIQKNIEGNTYEITGKIEEESLVATGKLPNFVIPNEGEKLWFGFEPSDIIIGI